MAELVLLCISMVLEGLRMESEQSRRGGKPRYVVNCGARQYIGRAMRKLDQAKDWCESAKVNNAVQKINTAQSEIQNVLDQLDEFERFTEAVAIVYAMRYRDKYTIPMIVMELRSMPPVFWMTARQVEYLLTRDLKAMEWHKNAC